MANVVFHPDAQAEFQAALSWNGQRSRRAAQGFECEVDRVLTVLASSAERYPFHDDVYREAMRTRYPYSLLYRLETDGDVLVVAVAHASREPGY